MCGRRSAWTVPNLLAEIAAAFPRLEQLQIAVDVALFPLPPPGWPTGSRWAAPLAAWSLSPSLVDQIGVAFGALPHLASFSLAIDGRMPQRDRPLYAARSGHGLTLRLPTSLAHLKLQLGADVDPIPYRLCLTPATATTATTLEIGGHDIDVAVATSAVATADSWANLETLDLRVPWWLGGLADGAGESKTAAAAAADAAVAAESRMDRELLEPRALSWVDDVGDARSETAESDTAAVAAAATAASIDVDADIDRTIARESRGESRRRRDPRDCAALLALPRLHTLRLETSLGTPWHLDILRRSAPSLTRLTLGSVALNCLGALGDGADADRDSGWPAFERLSLVLAEVRVSRRLSPASRIVVCDIPGLTHIHTHTHIFCSTRRSRVSTRFRFANCEPSLSRFASRCASAQCVATPRPLTTRRRPRRNC